MKRLLVFLLLIIFVVNIELECKSNEILDEQTQKCIKCKGGEIKNGKCACPLNKLLLKGDCIDKPPSNKCKNGIIAKDKCICKPGYIKNRNNECVDRNNQCIGGRKVNGVCKCPNGQTQKNGKCDFTPVSCPDGKITINRRCINRPIHCLFPKIRVNGICIEKAIKCPNGKTLVYGRCVDTTGLCPNGRPRINGRCIPFSCANGGIPTINGCTERRICPGGRLVNGRCERSTFPQWKIRVFNGCSSII